ncbi:hypothetical protein [Sphingomicrobium marinum]|uniref:hypothetical protein n=1 Tax=Sphingomicrobium marinum TaxID=1227950 RepID=UPI00223FA8BE|nr:hypothetical protein [Sphingomicrobium marinum]
MKQAAVLTLMLGLTACASTQRPVFNTPAQLNSAATNCGLALGELVQEEDARELLFVIREAPGPQERLCIYKFADANNLKVVLIDDIAIETE